MSVLAITFIPQDEVARIDALLGMGSLNDGSKKLLIGTHETRDIH
jgi:hypothetical protein